ncbi:hypothetical protein [Streptomyces sp. 142MFCol3.1]|uniref:hypothetical protein n=1 Tax=Streptomyces sp. 142MFCol3.1 TaxID=1172179 RepID=UPI0018F888EA|nr:hypothetical protein [Streptomyces sp. 142MFCol3.1]
MRRYRNSINAASGTLSAPAFPHPRRKQYYVGATTVATIWVNRLAPALLDRYLARTGIDAQQTNQRPPSGENNLYEPVDEAKGTDHGAHGVFDTASHSRSFEASLARHPVAASALATAVAATATAVWKRRARTSS